MLKQKKTARISNIRTVIATTHPAYYGSSLPFYYNIFYNWR
nr:MAG TPA: hypothetical protein [Caudoviricetes sp.]